VSVKILFFASLREQLGAAAEQLDLPPGVSTVGALRTHLMARGALWQAALGEKRALRVAVNQDIAQAATPVKAGDEVAFFPPVTGG
jgi:molybdopterin synthase sulfur carrier subunit